MRRRASWQSVVSFQLQVQANNIQADPAISYCYSERIMASEYLSEAELDEKIGSAVEKALERHLQPFMARVLRAAEEGESSKSVSGGEY